MKISVTIRSHAVKTAQQEALYAVSNDIIVIDARPADGSDAVVRIVNGRASRDWVSPRPSQTRAAFHIYNIISVIK